MASTTGEGDLLVSLMFALLLIVAVVGIGVAILRIGMRKR